MPNADFPGRQGSPADGAATRERIVEAAAAMFTARGYDGVPMTRVAEASGVTAAALYWHFKSKDDLYFEVIAQVYRAFFDELAEKTIGETAQERLYSYVRNFVELQLRDPDTMLFGIGQLGARLPEGRQEEFSALQKPYGALLGSILQEGTESGEFEIEDPRITALAIHTMCEYSAVWFRPDKRLSAAQVAAIHADLATRMTTPAGAPPG